MKNTGILDTKGQMIRVGDRVESDDGDIGIVVEDKEASGRRRFCAEYDKNHRRVIACNNEDCPHFTIIE